MEKVSVDELDRLESLLKKAIDSAQSKLQESLDIPGAAIPYEEEHRLYYLLQSRKIVREARMWVEAEDEREAKRKVSIVDTRMIVETVRGSKASSDKKDNAIKRLEELSGQALTRENMSDEILNIQAGMTIGSNCRCGGIHLSRWHSFIDCIKRYFGHDQYVYDVNILRNEGYSGLPYAYHVVRIRKDTFPADSKETLYACGGWSTGGGIAQASYLGTGPRSAATLFHSPKTFPDGASAFEYVERLRKGHPLHGWKASSIAVVAAATAVVIAEILGNILPLF